MLVLPPTTKKAEAASTRKSVRFLYFLASDQPRDAAVIAEGQRYLEAIGTAVKRYYYFQLGQTETFEISEASVYVGKRTLNDYRRCAGTGTCYTDNDDAATTIEDEVVLDNTATMILYNWRNVPVVSGEPTCVASAPGPPQDDINYNSYGFGVMSVPSCGENATVVAHELGHMFGLAHRPCGEAITLMYDFAGCGGVLPVLPNLKPSQADLLKSSPYFNTSVITNGCSISNAVGVSAKKDLTGNWFVDAAGKVANCGSAAHKGDLSGQTLSHPIVDIAATSDGGGYWLVASNGAVYAFGNAIYSGGANNLPLNKPIVGMAARPGGGYWLVASDGGIFSYGNAPFYGSTGNIKLNKPIIGMETTTTGNGYWLYAGDGGVFAFGGAAFYGSAGANTIPSPIVTMSVAPDGRGYTLTAQNGGIYNYGSAPFRGSTQRHYFVYGSIIGMAFAPDTNGYITYSSNGNMYRYGSARQVPRVVFVSNDSAVCSDISAPSKARVSSAVSVSAGFINNGNTVWNPPGTGEYGFTEVTAANWDAGGPESWGLTDYAGVSVGDTATMNQIITAPSTPGTYTLSLSMKKFSTGAFGEACTTTMVVEPYPIPELPPYDASMSWVNNWGVNTSTDNSLQMSWYTAQPRQEYEVCVPGGGGDGGPDGEPYCYTDSYPVNPPGYCIKIEEPSDPATWDDNQLCSNVDMGWTYTYAWTSSYVPPFCVRLEEPSDPYPWYDNVLCNHTSEGGRNLYWSYNGNMDDADTDCVSLNESVDPHTWYDNYLCWDTPVTKTLTPALSSSCAQMYPPSGYRPSYWDDNVVCAAPGNIALEYKWINPGIAVPPECTRVSEPSDPNWPENYGYALCSSVYIGHKWSYDGDKTDNITSCVPVSEPSQPPETNWSDNHICWDSSKPDLTVTNVTWEPETALPGNQVTFTATVTNQGTRATPSGVIHGISFKVDGQTVGWNAGSTSSLAPGQSATLTGSAGGPNGNGKWTASVGDHVVEAFIDDVNRITNESIEMNNTYQQNIIVQAPNTPPTTPANLSKTTVTASSVGLAWNASSDNTGIKHYQIYRNGVVIGTTTATTYTDTAFVHSSTNYTYMVSAVDTADVASNASTMLDVTTPAPPDTTAPNAPASTSASASAHNLVDVFWSAGTDNVGVTGYEVFRSTGAGSTPTTSRGIVTGLSYSDSTVVGNTTYVYAIKAVDAAGNKSNLSPYATVTTSSPPPDTVAPTAPTNLTGSAVSMTRINLSWTASTDNVGVARYDIYRNGTKVGSSTTTNYSDLTVVKNTTYTYTVRAVDAAGLFSPLSNTRSITTPRK